MKRVCIVCEGPTEVQFVENCLAPYLLTTGNLLVRPEVLRAPSGRHAGGHVSVDRVGRFIAYQYYRTDRITTLVDYYGFENVEGRDKGELEQAILAAACKSSDRINPQFVRPYVQMHEFEGLLFSDVSAFEGVVTGWNSKVDLMLKEIRRKFATPEDINNSPMTAPSKRLQMIFPRYTKTKYGAVIAKKIGINRIREECPLFDKWVEDLINWK